MTASNEYMRSKNIPSDLRFQIRDYMGVKFKDGMMLDEGETMAPKPIA